MIKIPVDLALVLYLVVPIIILVIWLFFEGRSNKPVKIKSKYYLWECPVCFYVYVDSKSGLISRCPRCKTLHKRGEKK